MADRCQSAALKGRALIDNLVFCCRPKDVRRAKYQLEHTVRVHLGCEDDAFGCMGNGEDSEGIKGVFLRRNVVNVAGRALKVNLQRLGPLVLPISEMVRRRPSLVQPPAAAFQVPHDDSASCHGLAAGHISSNLSSERLLGVNPDPQ